MRNAPTLVGEPDEETTRTARAVGLTILGHPDPERVGERAALLALAGGQAVPLSRLEPPFAAPGDPPGRPLEDPHLSRRPLHLRLAAGGGVHLAADPALPVTADGQDVQPEREFSRAELEGGIVLVLANRIVLLLHPVDPSPPRGLPSFGLIGENASMVALRQEVLRVADLAVPVLLRGATGTGKELVARAVHDAGARRRRPYVTVNMGGIPPTLAAAELFGAARGAYTGAERSRAGYFTRAQGGTLFLDEIGETPPEVQVLLLRALESGEIQPVGADTAVTIDVRVIAATDADLERAVAQGRFRAPLLHRLNAYEIRIPPLRERRDDVGRLLVHFLRQELQAVGEGDRLLRPDPAGPPWLSASVIARFAAYDWPGNLRQMRNVVRRIVIANRGRPRLQVGLELDHLLSAETEPEPGRAEPALLAERPTALEGPPASSEKAQRRRKFRPPAEVGEAELLEALRANRWRVQPAAEQLGVSRPSLYDLMDKSPLIRKPGDVPASELRASFEACGGNVTAMAEKLEVSQPGLERRLRDLGLRTRRA